METKAIPYRPIGLIANAVEEAGLNVSYFYENLIFVESNVILLKMCEDPKEVLLYSNENCAESDAKDLEIRIAFAARKEGLQVSYSGKFKLDQLQNKEVKITFL